jgi:hypothetical protein
MVWHAGNEHTRVKIWKQRLSLHKEKLFGHQPRQVIKRNYRFGNHLFSSLGICPVKHQWKSKAKLSKCLLRPLAPTGYGPATSIVLGRYTGRPRSQLTEQKVCKQVLNCPIIYLTYKICSNWDPSCWIHKLQFSIITLIETFHLKNVGHLIYRRCSRYPVSQIPDDRWR